MNVGSLIVVTNCHWSLLSPLTERFSRATKMSLPPPLTFLLLLLIVSCCYPFLPFLPPLVSLSMFLPLSNDAVSPRLEGSTTQQRASSRIKAPPQTNFYVALTEGRPFKRFADFFLRDLRFIYVIDQVLFSQRE